MDASGLWLDIEWTLGGRQWTLAEHWVDTRWTTVGHWLDSELTIVRHSLGVTWKTVGHWWDVEWTFSGRLWTLAAQ